MKEDFIGRRFGMLTVVENSGEKNGNSILWRCRCDCGKEILAVRHQLTGGTLKNCGCSPEPPRQRVTDLIGQRFGKLTVTGDSGQRTAGGCILWRCRCDCGGEILAQRSRIVSGNITSCGCVPRRHVPKMRAEDLTGRRFGELTVLSRAENDKDNRVRWLCRCSCGKTACVLASRLKSGHTRSCGCKRHASSPDKRDLTGQRFGRLTVLYSVKRDSKRNKLCWHCRCDCGNEIDVFPGSLLRGLTQSCGCWNKEQAAKICEHMHFQDNTCLERLNRATLDTDTNKAGFRGLFLTRKGTYRASITFQKVHYTLGYYRSFKEAVQARLEAEESLHKGYMNAFAAYEKKAKTDPAWAENNPFYYQVARVNGNFRVVTNGA